MALSGWRLETRRLVIRDFRFSDCTDEYVAGLNDKQHLIHSSQGRKVHTAQTQIDYVREFIGTPNFFLALELRELTTTVIGSMTVYFSANLKEMDLGIFVHPVFTEQGLGSEAWRAVVETATTAFAVERMTAGTSCRNASMRSILSSSGFKGLTACSYGSCVQETGPCILRFYR